MFSTQFIIYGVCITLFIFNQQLTNILHINLNGLYKNII